MLQLYGIQQTELIAIYMQKLLAHELAEADWDLQMPNCQLDFLEELHYTIKLVIQALKNQSE